MNVFVEMLKAVLFGIIEGITEWLPVSSTGHMILLDEFVKVNLSEKFFEFFLVAIQLGAILAVIIIFFKALNPLSKQKTRTEQYDTWNMWGNIIIACVPAGLLGVILDEILNKYLYNFQTVGLMLIIYGIIFIVFEIFNNKKEQEYQIRLQAEKLALKQLEKENPTFYAHKHKRSKKNHYKINKMGQMNAKTAFKIGMFQCLSLIPGTSRSGITILGGMASGCDREVSTEFSFYLAIPIMLGASVFKAFALFKDKYVPTSNELLILIIGSVVAFLISYLIIKFLLAYIRKHDFKIFGWYRILLGVVVLVYFIIKMNLK